MVDPKLINNWIEKANEDLEYARISLKEDLEFYPQICFHLHQAVEKYLKAYIIAHELDFQKTHDLGQLVKICGQKDNEFNQYFDKLADLNSYYIETRYPDFEVTVNKTQAENALNLTEQIAVFVKGKISQQAEDGSQKTEDAAEAVEGEVVEESASAEGSGEPKEEPSSAKASEGETVEGEVVEDPSAHSDDSGQASSGQGKKKE